MSAENKKKTAGSIAKRPENKTITVVQISDCSFDGISCLVLEVIAEHQLIGGLKFSV